MKKKIVLTIIDGLGLREEEQGNGFALANTPTFDKLFKGYPNSIIQASGKYVGLPEGQMGNSEVGHLNIGAGQIVYTGLTLINNAIKENTFTKKSAFLKAFKNVKKNNQRLHLMGLLSPGGVHSQEEHLFELLKIAYEYGLQKVSIHIFGDGRDVKPQSILISIEKLDSLCHKYHYDIASISGRYYAMDRDEIFERNQKAFNALIGKSQTLFKDVKSYIKAQYKKNIFDEFFIPAQSKKDVAIKENDSIIFFNFRPDRARQLTHFFKPSKIFKFKNTVKMNIPVFVSLMKYEGMDTEIAFQEMKIKETLGKVASDNNLKQLRIAETQKYAHVTFFMDGGIDIVYKNQDRILIDSIKSKNFANHPKMSAKEITNELITNMTKYDLVIMNYANPDMVGHTGDLQATIKAIEFLDSQFARILFAIENKNITWFITADHGNAEITESKDGKSSTKHTDSPVMLICSDKDIQLKENGKLADIAPTIIEYLKLNKPKVMSGESLLVKK